MRHRGGRFFVEEIGAASQPLPGSVDDAIADIATIFHWPPSAYGAMPLAELASWREAARLRSGAADNE
ncbi:GpE family phage tail protein [Chromobacterium subtsugae]|uniref:GpE family phage tail protein n=1 Tax=Chromobacterium subtsugae TaxID=251747 RepID=UPI0009BCB393|nr:GpE family phage tail protein [Chromobacterium subtsugae]